MLVLGLIFGVHDVFSSRVPPFRGGIIPNKYQTAIRFFEEIFEEEGCGDAPHKCGG
jgi:hypothetical protein